MNISRLLLPILFPKYTWKRPADQKIVHLTFDDGPIPEVTEWVLDLLLKHKIKATFFCIGDNVRKHPHIFARIVSEGHRVGNHTFNHLNGWKNTTEDYIANTTLAHEQMLKHATDIDNARLFRPPYGKLKRKQADVLIKGDYEVIMWSHLTKDYDKNTTPEQCYKRAIENMAPGSIIVFHDSIKASKNLYYALPKTIEYLLNSGFTISPL